jgi:hypothetical protein
MKYEKKSKGEKAIKNGSIASFLNIHLSWLIEKC